MYRMSDLTALSTFVTAARAGSFAGAARQLGLSPAMVGRRIQALEEHFGARLIERTTRSFRLTDIGHAFLDKSADILEAVEELQETAQPGKDRLAGRVRISAPATLGIHTLSGVLARMAEKSPDLSIELVLSNRNADLVSEGFDLAVRIGELPASGLIARRVGTYRFSCCASANYIARRGVPKKPADLASHVCLLDLNISQPDRWLFYKGHNKDRARPTTVRGSFSVDSGVALRRAALDGGGIVYVPRHLVLEDIKAKRLVELFADWRKAELPIHTVHPSRRMVPRRVLAVIEEIRRSLNSDGLRP